MEECLSQTATYRKSPRIRIIVCLAPEILIFGHHRAVVVIIFPVLHIDSAVDRHAVDDVQLVCWDQLVLAVVWLAAFVQIFGSVQPGETDVDVLLVQRANFEHFRFPLVCNVNALIFTGFVIVLD